MKKLILAIAILAFVGTTQAQFTTDYFWHPRPMPTMKTQVGLTFVQQTTSGTVWALMPEFSLSASEVRFGRAGAPNLVSFIKGGGFGLSVAHLTYKDDGLGNVSNYVDASVNAGVLLKGTTGDSPVFTPKVVIMVGALNNLIQIGPGYDLVDRNDGYSRVTIEFTVNYLPFLNAP
jgi:hypothetical protein